MPLYKETGIFSIKKLKSLIERLTGSYSMYELAILISLPHILYFFIWTNPARWAALFSQLGLDAVDAMVYAASALKAVQFTAAYLWLWGSGLPGIAGGIGGAAAGVLLVSAGQYLNFSVYKLLGRHGVYYGFLLGKEVPWCTQWPYGPSSLLPEVPHPQYVGSSLTVAGLACAAGTLPGYCLLAFWSALYSLTAWQESSLPHGTPVKAHQ